MKIKIIASQICLVLLYNTQILMAQTSLTTSYKNDFSPVTCLPNDDDWAKCKCKEGIAPWNTNGSTWPFNYNAFYEWKGVTEGNSLSEHVNYDKIFGLSGTVADATIAGSDFPFTHVFGYDPNNPAKKLVTDWESYIVVDAPYVNLLGKGNIAKDKNGRPIPGEYTDAINKTLDEIKKFGKVDKKFASIEFGVMGLELESGLIPTEYRSQPGDRTVVFGDLIVDCGHDDGGYHTEIHPPLMLVNARAFNGTNPLNTKQILTEVNNATFATIISRPYKITQLFNEGLPFLSAAAFELNKAITLAETVGIFTGFLAPTYHLTMNAQIADKPFRGIQLMSFDVYPQKPKGSADELLWDEYHFTVRNGVAVNVVRSDDHLTVFVSMNDLLYNSATNLLKKHERNLDHNDFVTQQFGDVYAASFLVANVIPGVGPIVELGIKSTMYENPQPKSNFDSNIFPSKQPNNFSDISDDQPFPIYGWVTVGWKKPEPIKDICVVRPIQLTTNIGKVNFMPDNFTKSQLITINNPTDQPIQLGKLSVDGQDGNRFLLQNKTVILLRPGMQQPSEDISGTTIPAHSNASFRVAISHPVQENLIATIHIPSQGCELRIPVREFNSFVQ